MGPVVTGAGLFVRVMGVNDKRQGAFHSVEPCAASLLEIKRYEKMAVVRHVIRCSTK